MESGGLDMGGILDEHGWYVVWEWFLFADLERYLQVKGKLYFGVLNGSNDRMFLQVC